MFDYYLTYRNKERTTPTGIFVADAYGAMLWDHWAKAWVYDPGLVRRFLESYDNIDWFDVVDRETAERAAPQITGGEELPDEETIRWIFEWRGDPPQADE